MGEGVDARRMQEWVRRGGGVARASSLIEAGWSRWRVQRAVESGVLARPRQGWVAAPGADPHLVEAAGSGLLVGCVTQAARLGLWSLEASDRHFAVAAPGGTIRAPHASILHYQRPVAPRERFSVVDRIENVLDQVARCLPLEQAVTVWDSALNRGLVELHELARLGYTGRAREVLALADPYADSGLESLMRLRLRRLPARVRS